MSYKGQLSPQLDSHHFRHGNIQEASSCGSLSSPEVSDDDDLLSPDESPPTSDGERESESGPESPPESDDEMDFPPPWEDEVESQIEPLKDNSRLTTLHVDRSHINSTDKIESMMSHTANSEYDDLDNYQLENKSNGSDGVDEFERLETFCNSSNYASEDDNGQFTVRHRREKAQHASPLATAAPSRAARNMLDNPPKPPRPLKPTGSPPSKPTRSSPSQRQGLKNIVGSPPKPPKPMKATHKPPPAATQSIRAAPPPLPCTSQSLPLSLPLPSSALLNARQSVDPPQKPARLMTPSGMGEELPAHLPPFPSQTQSHLPTLTLPPSLPLHESGGNTHRSAHSDATRTHSTRGSRTSIPCSAVEDPPLYYSEAESEDYQNSYIGTDDVSSYPDLDLEFQDENFFPPQEYGFECNPQSVPGPKGPGTGLGSRRRADPHPNGSENMEYVSPQKRSERDAEARRRHREVQKEEQQRQRELRELQHHRQKQRQQQHQQQHDQQRHAHTEQIQEQQQQLQQHVPHSMDHPSTFLRAESVSAMCPPSPIPLSPPSPYSSSFSSPSHSSFPPSSAPSFHSSSPPSYSPPRSVSVSVSSAQSRQMDTHYPPPPPVPPPPPPPAPAPPVMRGGYTRQEILDTKLKTPKLSVPRVRLLCGWLSSLQLWHRPIEIENVGSEFQSGLLLVRLIQFLEPSAVFRHVTQKVLHRKPAVQNIEQVLGHVLRSKKLNTYRIPTAEEVYLGNVPKVLTFLFELFEVYVVRVWGGWKGQRTQSLLLWLDSILCQYSRHLHLHSAHTQAHTHVDSSIDCDSHRGGREGSAYGQGHGQEQEDGQIFGGGGSGMPGIYPHLPASASESPHTRFRSGTDMFCVIYHFFGPVTVQSGPKALAIDPKRVYFEPVCLSEMRSNVSYVFDLLEALGIDVFWTADEWISLEDCTFAILQLYGLRRLCGDRLCALPLADTLNAVSGITSGPLGMSVVVGLIFADTPSPPPVHKGEDEGVGEDTREGPQEDDRQGREDVREGREGVCTRGGGASDGLDETALRMMHSSLSGLTSSFSDGLPTPSSVPSSSLHPTPDLSSSLGNTNKEFEASLHRLRHCDFSLSCPKGLLSSTFFNGMHTAHEAKNIPVEEDDRDHVLQNIPEKSSPVRKVPSEKQNVLAVLNSKRKPDIPLEAESTMSNTITSERKEAEGEGKGEVQSPISRPGRTENSHSGPTQAHPTQPRSFSHSFSRSVSDDAPLAPSLPLPTQPSTHSYLVPSSVAVTSSISTSSSDLPASVAAPSHTTITHTHGPGPYFSPFSFLPAQIQGRSIGLGREKEGEKVEVREEHSRVMSAGGSDDDVTLISRGASGRDGEVESCGVSRCPSEIEEENVRLLSRQGSGKYQSLISERKFHEDTKMKEVEKEVVVEKVGAAQCSALRTAHTALSVETSIGPENIPPVKSSSPNILSPYIPSVCPSPNPFSYAMSPPPSPPQNPPPENGHTSDYPPAPTLVLRKENKSHDVSPRPSSSSPPRAPVGSKLVGAKPNTPSRHPTPLPASPTHLSSSSPPRTRYSPPPPRYSSPLRPPMSPEDTCAAEKGWIPHTTKGYTHNKSLNAAKALAIATRMNTVEPPRLREEAMAQLREEREGEGAGSGSRRGRVVTKAATPTQARSKEVVGGQRREVGARVIKGGVKVVEPELIPELVPFPAPVPVLVPVSVPVGEDCAKTSYTSSSSLPLSSSPFPSPANCLKEEPSTPQDHSVAPKREERKTSIPRYNVTKTETCDKGEMLQIYDEIRVNECWIMQFEDQRRRQHYLDLKKAAPHTAHTLAPAHTLCKATK